MSIENKPIHNLYIIITKKTLKAGPYYLKVMYLKLYKVKNVPDIVKKLCYQAW